MDVIKNVNEMIYKEADKVNLGYRDRMMKNEMNSMSNLVIFGFKRSAICDFNDECVARD